MALRQRYTIHSLRRQYAGNISVICQLASMAWSHIDSCINYRADLERNIKAGLRHDDKGDYVMLYWDERDCDHVRVTYARRVDKPTPMVLMELEREASKNAEGPFSWYILLASDELPESAEHDYIAEAFEDGHPHSVGY